MKNFFFFTFLVCLSCTTSENCKNPEHDVQNDVDSNNNNNSNKGTCYEIGLELTNADCMVHSVDEEYDCFLRRGFIGYLRSVGNSVCLFSSGPLRWFETEDQEILNSAIPLCMKGYTAIDNVMIDVIPRWCKFLSEYIVLYVDGVGLIPPDDWFICHETIPDCSSTCGNGVIEPGEVCDGEQLGAPSDCAVFSEIMNYGGYTSGTLSCNELCHWDFSDCQ